MVFISKTLLISQLRSKEVWNFDDKIESINQKYLKLLRNINHFGAVPFPFDQYKP